MEKCEIGGMNDGTLRVCCSSHGKTLCAHHYARTHFVETDPAWPLIESCTSTSKTLDGQWGELTLPVR
jgi:hypothetical protein